MSKESLQTRFYIFPRRCVLSAMPSAGTVTSTQRFGTPSAQRKAATAPILLLNAGITMRLEARKRARSTHVSSNVTLGKFPPTRND
jgi:hypothetical protein